MSSFKFSFKKKIILIFIIIISGFFSTILLNFLYENSQEINQDVIKDNLVVYPVRIKISELEIDLPIELTSLNSGKWSTSEKGVSLLVLDEKKKQYLIYGHNWPTLLKNLKKTELSQLITLFFDNGDTEKFSITKKYLVKQNQIDFIDTDFDLLIYTCDGFWNEKRLIIEATLI